MRAIEGRWLECPQQPQSGTNQDPEYEELCATRLAVVPVRVEVEGGGNRQHAQWQQLQQLQGQVW